MIDAAELIEYVQGAATDEDELVRLEAAAVARVQEFTGRYFGPATSDTFIIRGKGLPKLRLPEPPTADITSVIERAYLGADQTTITAAEDTGFELRIVGSEGFLFRKRGLMWTRGYEYIVTMPYGYADEDVPKVVREKVRQLVLLWWSDKALGAGAYQSRTEGRVSFTTGNRADGGAEEAVLAGLLGWRRYGVAGVGQ